MEEPNFAPDSKIRVDIWLWAVRIFKTRSLASAACKGGHVRINDNPAKASTPVRIGDKVKVKIQGFDRILEVTATLKKRGGAPLAQQCYLDHSPERLPRIGMPALPVRERGTGRPTKKERRELDRLRGRDGNYGRLQGE